ncbi:MAG: bestrophin family ion channel [Sandaracinaceae bacterium]
MQNIDESIRVLLDVQGGCERIKKTPLPRGYGFIAQRLILTFAFLFPLCLAAELGWWIIPINVFVVLSFGLISEAGRVLEDPFTMFWNGLPLSNMSSTIEVNLLERLGETELPEVPGPTEYGVLYCRPPTRRSPRRSRRGPPRPRCPGPPRRPPA